jgi:proteasome lid subunit RPN8/RPN11
LAPGVLDRLRRRALVASPRECCGLLIGRLSALAVDVRATLPVPNAAADAARRFSIPAATILPAQRAAESKGLDVVGFYHSHPFGGAEPSREDIDGAAAGYLHVIVGSDGARAWRRADPDQPLAEVSL